MSDKKYIEGAADDVNQPSHYCDGGIETIDFIEAKELGFHLGNAVKYISRAGKKGLAVKDIQKAAWYLARWLAHQGQKLLDETTP